MGSGAASKASAMAGRSARGLLASLVVGGTIVAGLLPAGAQQARCGELITLPAHDGATVPYSLALPPSASAAAAASGPRVALILLPGSSGYAALDAGGCATRLKGNWLVRSRELFHRAGFATALVDAPSDSRGRDGLGGFRLAVEHAEDIGKVIADVRQRTGLPVWLLGTSRGTISAANAASRLTGPAAPDGLILTSPVTSGTVGGRKAWLAQTVLRTKLEAIAMPLLVVSHAADTCIRTPPHLAPSIAARAGATRKQTAAVKGGPDSAAQSDEACEGRSPHGFIGQEAAVVAGIARFVRGGSF